MDNKLQNPAIRKLVYFLKNQVKDTSRHHTREYTRTENKYLRICSTSYSNKSQSKALEWLKS